MRFSMIIPVYNGGEKISRTIQSAFSQTSVQSGADSITIHVIDGNSTDDTVARARAFDDPRLRVTSEDDDGMYDALAKGLVEADGDITCYLPAGEIFDPHAFSVVSEVFTSNAEIHWLTGRSVARNANGQIIDSRLPHPFSRRFFQCGMYGTRLTALQQESTFWRTDLNALVDLDALRRCKLAGDYFMWKCMSSRHDIFVVNTHLSAFTLEPGQLSQQVPGAYRRELRALRRRPALWERLAALLHRQYVKRIRPGRRAPRLIRFDHVAGEWRLTRH